MIIIKSKQEIDIMREAGKVTGDVLRKLEDFVKPGISTCKIYGKMYGAKIRLNLL